MHWTYEHAIDQDDDLCQGDILGPTEELLTLFNKVHPYFVNLKKYRGFLVLTHSCDLVRRNEKRDQCSATHICLCVIRSMQDVISDSLKSHFGCLAPGVYNRGLKKTAEMLLERIVNQNEHALGLFYLHPDVDAGIAVPSVAILRVTISFRSKEHYDLLRRSRIGRLSKEFQPKLGWMVGNIYSRVGVKDWKEGSKEEELELINSIIRFTRNEPLWVEKKVYEKIIKERPDFADLSEVEQEDIIKEFSPKPPLEKAIEIIIKTIKDVIPRASEQDLEKIRTRLKNNETLDAQMKKIAKSE